MSAAPVFERSMPPRATALAVAVAVGLWSLVGAAIVLLVLPAWRAPFVAVADELPLVPSGEVIVVGTLLGLVAALMGATLLAIGHARRRYGRCTFGAERALFEPALASSDVCLLTPLVDVDQARSTPHGLLLEVPGRNRVLELAFPLLVPTRGEEETRRALELVQGVGRGPAGAERPSAFGRRSAALGVQAVGVLALCMVVSQLTGLLLDQAGLDGPGLVVMGGGLVAALGAAAWLGVKALGPRRRRLYAASDALLIDDESVLWDHLTEVALAPPHLAVASGGRRWVVRLGEELPAAAERIGERLASSGRDLRVAADPPAWVAEVVRLQRVLFAVLLALLLGGLVLLHSVATATVGGLGP